MQLVMDYRVKISKEDLHLYRVGIARGEMKVRDFRTLLETSFTLLFAHDLDRGIYSEQLWRMRNHAYKYGELTC